MADNNTIFCSKNIALRNPDDFYKIANKFEHLWNFVGYVDGKHARIKCPKNSGSRFYNYKKYFSNFSSMDRRCKL